MKGSGGGKGTRRRGREKQGSVEGRLEKKGKRRKRRGVKAKKEKSERGEGKRRRLAGKREVGEEKKEWG